jgi:hypothetical protein
VAFYFSRIGNDDGAKELIEGLDNDEELGRWIDCFPGMAFITGYFAFWSFTLT